MKEVAQVPDATNAQLLCGFLRSHGIPAHVAGGDRPNWGFRGGGNDGGASLFVPDEFEQRARELIAEYAAQRTFGESWFCPKCGDVVPPAFGECPVCRVVRPPKKSQMPFGD